jgi:hypothetical protein
MAKQITPKLQDFLKSAKPRITDQLGSNPTIRNNLIRMISDEIGEGLDEEIEGEARVIFGREGIIQLFSGGLIYQNKAVLIGSNGGNSEFEGATYELQRSLEGSKLSSPEWPLVKRLEDTIYLINRKEDFKECSGKTEFLDLLTNPKLYKIVPVAGILMLNLADSTAPSQRVGKLGAFLRTLNAFPGHDIKLAESSLQDMPLVELGLCRDDMYLFESARDRRLRLVPGGYDYQLWSTYSKKEDTENSNRLDQIFVPQMVAAVKEMSQLAGKK